MRIIFMGSDRLACPALEVLAKRADDELVGIIAQPDRPKGRRRKPAPCDLKRRAEELELPVWTPEKIGAPESVERIRQMEPDIITVVAYGQYIPEKVLGIPPHGAVNLHPSLLPRYRGASPVQWAVANGDVQTGVTILYVSKEMDAGDIILQAVQPIHDDDNAVTLAARLAEQGAQMLCQVLDMHHAGEIPRMPQDETQATVVHKLSKEDGRIDWTLDAATLRNRIRGFQPWPLCFCEWPRGSGHYLRITAAQVESRQGPPGCILEAKGEGPLVAAGDRALRLIEVQPEGKRCMSGRAFLCGHSIEPGTIIG
jgi:methionyl-tRNA formyltransferase